MIGLIGIDHTTATIDERAALALTPAEGSMLIQDWQACGLLTGAVILSTCNRVEIYYEAEDGCHASVERRLRGSLLGNLEVSPRLSNKLRTLREADAVEHLFRLGAGLESMVMGETQILGQLKDAYRYASAHALCTGALARLFHRAFEVSKIIRSSYFVASSSLSAGGAAVDRLLADAPELIGRPTLIVGAGLMAETIFERLSALGAEGVCVYNRTRERAERFAEHHPTARIAYERTLRHEVEQAEVIFVATSAPSPIIEAEHLPQLHGRKTIFDLAVPRNVAEVVGTLPHIRLYSIDDLSGYGEALSADDRAHIDQIITEHTRDYLHWVEGAHLRSVIGRIHSATDAILRSEQEALPTSLSTELREEVKRYQAHLATTLSTALTTALRELSDDGRRSKPLPHIDQLFTLVAERLTP